MGFGCTICTDFGTMTVMSREGFLISWNPTQKCKRKLFSRNQKAIDPTNAGTSYHHKPQNTGGKEKPPKLHNLFGIRKQRKTIWSVTDCKQENPENNQEEFTGKVVA